MKLRNCSMAEGIGGWDSDAGVKERQMLIFCSTVANLRMRASLRRAKLVTEGVADIAIVPVFNRLPEPTLFAHILPIHVSFDWQRFLEWSGGMCAADNAIRSNDSDAFSKLHGPSEVIRDMICDVMRRGLERVPKALEVPTEILEKMVDEIQSMPYEISWTYCSRRFAQLGLTARLECLLLAGQFQLSLTVLRGKQLAWTGVILSSLPEAIFWRGDFKDIELRGDSLIVTHSIAAFNPDKSLNFDLFALPLDKIAM